MYLRELFIKNNGPIRDLHLEFGFNPDGRPLPHVIVGPNGTGKTNLLSIIGDSIMEGAADVYKDLLKTIGGTRNWFRVAGGQTITYNAEYSYSLLRFQHAGQTAFYREHSGNVSPSTALNAVPSSLSGAVDWANDGHITKKFKMPEDAVREIYPHGAYLYFPSNRSEVPHWLNLNSIQRDEFDTAIGYEGMLGKPVFVERGINSFTKWILGVLADSRAELTVERSPESNSRIGWQYTIAYPEQVARSRAILESANEMLQIIMDSPDARFFWAGRHHSQKVGIAIGNIVVASGLNSLSGGQSSLLAIFGTILHHSDVAGVLPSELEGIVVIDEVDAHVHIDLQQRSLPELIALFPKVQFIISGHSPFFPLGMEKRFSSDGVRIIGLPSGLSQNAEAYADFAHALKAIKGSRVFEDEVRTYLESSESPIVFVGGETDLTYFRTAADFLGFRELSQLFEWIGTTGSNGSASHSGDNALNTALNFIQANPSITKRIIVFVYDCDANKSTVAIADNLHVVAIPVIAGRKATIGIENLLPDSVLTSDFYTKKETTGPYGQRKIIEEFNKSDLCTHLCGENARKENFGDFRPVLEQIHARVFPSATGTASEPKL